MATSNVLFYPQDARLSSIQRGGQDPIVPDICYSTYPWQLPLKLTHHSGGCRSGQTMPQVPSTSQAVGPAISMGQLGEAQGGQ